MADSPKEPSPSETERGDGCNSSRIIKLEAMVWGFSTEEALQELKDWGAPLVEPDVPNPRELALRMASGGTIQPGSWDIIVKYEDGEFAVFSRLNTAPIFSRRRR